MLNAQLRRNVMSKKHEEELEAAEKAVSDARYEARDAYETYLLAGSRWRDLEERKSDAIDDLLRMRASEMKKEI